MYDWFLQHLWENRLFTKAEKCKFHVTTVQFLGFIIEQGQLLPDSSKVKAVAEWPHSVLSKTAVALLLLYPGIQ